MKKPMGPKETFVQTYPRHPFADLVRRPIVLTKWCVRLACLLSLVMWPAATHGQSSALVDALNRYMVMYAQGRDQDALPFAEEALRLSEEEFGPDHINTGWILNELALLHHANGRYSEAEPLYKRVLAILEKVLGPKHPDVATTMENHAALLRETGRVGEAQDMEIRAKAIRDKHAQ